MSRLVMSVVGLAMGVEADGGGNSNNSNNNNMVCHFFFSLNPFININSTLNPKMRTISDRLSLEHDASDRKYMKYFYL